jgi:type II secretory pathway component PulM
MPASSGLTARSNSQVSVLPGTTQTSSAISRAADESRTARASTASRTVTGTVSVPAANTSVTKSGLPPVTLWRLVAGHPACLASFATASSESGESAMRRVHARGKSPMTNRSG